MKAQKRPKESLWLKWRRVWKGRSRIQSKYPAQQKSFNCRSDPEHRCAVPALWVWTLIKHFDMNGSLGINSRLPAQGSCSSTARAMDELLIAQGLCQHFDKRVQGRWRAKGGWNLKRNLLQLAEGISSARAEHRAHLGLAPVLPFPLNSYISIWKNNFAWQNTVYGKWAHFSWWFRCHRNYEAKPSVLKGCRLLTEITRNIMLWDLTFIHSVHQVLICT